MTDTTCGGRFRDFTMVEKRLSAVAALVLSLAGCQGPPPAQADPSVVAPTPQAAAKRDAFGDPLSSASEKVLLTDLVKSPGKYADKTVITEGKIVAVCASKGCWIEIGDESGSAHVKLGGHKFFVPRSANGRNATVEAKVLPAVDEGHCEAEAKEQTGKVAKIELVATGVELF